MKSTWFYFFEGGTPAAIRALAAALTELRLQGADARAVEIGPMDPLSVSVLGLWVRAPNQEILMLFREGLEARMRRRKLSFRGVPWIPLKTRPSKDPAGSTEENLA